MTVEERRHIASLQTVKGYQQVVTLVVGAEMDAVRDRLLTSTDKETVWKSSVEYQLLQRLLGELTGLPQRMVEALKEEGDEIYGA